ncbi:MAG TPA: UBP-type zinc finger domain-containing protein [Candidatus Limnocylindrales bacterium]|nr:UBP-type zinc finger domain-containing protein [Candidatus Limnocylindrales bacterium]
MDLRTQHQPASPPRPAARLCPHAPETIAQPSGDRCEECGSDFNLRLCATCGHVGCCESQAGHGRAHALGSGHAVILQMPAGEGFTWCYTENRYL